MESNKDSEKDEFFSGKKQDKDPRSRETINLDFLNAP